MKTLRFTLVFSILLFTVYMTANAQKHLFAEESTESGLRKINKIEQSPLKERKRTVKRDSEAQLVQNLKKDEILKIAEKIVQSEQNTILYANYHFDRNGVLTKRAKYIYDENDNLVEYNQN